MTTPTSHDPLISIVMPLYNGAAFVDAAIESVLAQGYERWELVVIDDGSRDDGPERARRWVERDGRIRLLQHPGGANRGVSETRNLGIRESTGEWIALLDCDDVWLPHKLERQLGIVRAQPGLSLIYSKARVIDDEGREVTERGGGSRREPVFGSGVPDQPVHDYPGFIAGRYWPPASSTIFPREAAAACGNFEPLPLQVEDTLLFMRLSTVGAIWFTDEVLLHYRIHGNQWNSSTYPSRKAAGRFCYLERLLATVAPEYRAVTAEVLLERGVRGLARTLISAFEISPLRLVKYLGPVLGNPHIPLRMKARAVRIVLGRLLWMPAQLVPHRRYVRSRNVAAKV